MKDFSKIKLIVFDFDGIFTDGKVTTDENGIESVICSRKDTLRFPELKNAGIKLAVISKEKNPIVKKRCEKMEIECFQSADKKINILKQLIERENILAEETAFMGDDINDLECLKFVGVAFTVANADDECKKIAYYTTIRKGGDHAVREICDLILKDRADNILNNE